MSKPDTPAPLTQEQALDLIETHQIGQAEVIALRRAICGFVVDANGTEHRLDETCEHLRTADQRPGAGDNFIDQAKRRIGSAMARKRGGHWCGDCGCPLAKKTTIGFDPISSQPAIYERARCPLKKW